MAMEDAGSTSSLGERVTSPTRIVALLRRIQDARALLTITFSGTQQKYSSALLDVREQEKTLLLDEISPRTGHLLLQEQTRLQARARLQGIDVSFTCQLLESGVDHGVAIYKMHLPEMLLYRQRRASFRVPVASHYAAFAHLWTSDGRLLEGPLRDISLGGVAVSVLVAAAPGEDAAAGLALGDIVPRCTIDLPNHATVSSPLEVRYVRRDARQGAACLGGRFLRLDPAERKLIQEFVIKLQRALIRTVSR